MTDLFAQQGINFMSSQMASTAPSATPAPITAPKVDLENAPANQTIAPVSVSQLQAPVNNNGPIPSPPGPQDIATAPSGEGGNNPGVSAAAGGAPPQPPANQNEPTDLFQQEGVSAPSITQINTNAFNAGVQVPPVAAQDGSGATLDLKDEGLPIGSNNGPQANVDAAAYAENQQKQMMTLAYSRFTPEQIQAWQQTPITFSEAFRKLSPSQYLPGGGLKQLYNAEQILSISNKVQNGEPVTPDDQKTLNAYLDDQIEMSVRKFTWGGNVAYIGAQIPAFVAEFALADGVGKMAAKGVTMAAEEAGVNAALSTATSAATRVATTTALMPAQYAAKYGERRLNDSMAVTDKGQLVLQQSTESPATSAALAFAHTSADVAGQVAAPVIGKYIIDPVKKLISTPIVAAAKNLAPEVTDSLYQAWKAIEPNATVSKMFTSAGWAGMLEQLGANRVQQALNATIDYAHQDKMTFDQYLDAMTPSKDQLMVEGGLIAIAGAVHTSTSVAAGLLTAKGVPVDKATEAVNNMTAIEKDNFVSQNLQTPQSEVPKFTELRVQPEFRPTLSTDKEQPEVHSIVQTMHADDAQSSDNDTRLLASQTQAQAEANPPLIQEKESGFNAGWKTFKNEIWPSLYAETINDVQPIEDLTAKARAAGATVPEGQDTALTTSFTKSTPEWIRRNWMTNTTTWDSEGNQVVTGKGLKAIYDDFDNMFLTTEPNVKTRQQDFDDYLIAKRLLEEKASDRDVLVTTEQEKKSGEDLARLADKYGQNSKYFETFANEIRDWDNRILHNLVTSGLKTQEWFDQTTAARVHYSPLNRVVAEDHGPTSLSGKAIGKDVTPSRIGSLKQFKGSELEIKNTFQSRLKNSAIILQKAAVNKLRADISKFAEFYPDDVKVTRPAIIREAVEHSYDPKLRTKLEELVKFLGGEVKREDHVMVDGKKVLGAYDTKTKDVLMSRGTTEGTLTHEAGHMLDYMLGLKKRLLGDAKIKVELQNLAEDRLRAEITLQKNAKGQTEFAENIERAPKKYMNYLKNDDEVLANFFDAWVNSPEQVERDAPHAKAAFEKLIAENPQLAVLKDIRPSTSRAVETLERALLDQRGPKGSIPVYLDGRRMYMELSPELEKAFKAMSPMQMGMVERFLGGIFRSSKKLLQFGATASPDFMIRHFYRAIFTSFLNTKGNSPLDFLKHATISMPKAIFAVLGKNELYRDWASSSGALSTYMDLSDKGLAKLQKDMFENGNMASFLNPINWYHMAKEVSDYAPRIAAYEKMKSQGASDLAAGIMSLEATGNYIRHGSFTQRINQYAPFFNDMVQGGDRFVRSIMRNPAAFTARATATILIPQVIMAGYYLYAADDKTRQEYLNLPDWRRSLSMNIKIGNIWVPLPRAFAPGFVFGAIPEKIMIYMYKGNHPELKNFWLRMLAETATSVSPVFDWTRAMNPVMKSVLENITNYSFFMQRPLFSGDVQRTAPQNQFNQYSSETAKLVGKMFRISPTAIDNTVYDMAAKTGRFAMQLSDIGINTARRLAGNAVNEKAVRPTDNPLYGGLIEETPRGTGTMGYQEFREHLQEAQQTRNQQHELKGQEAADFQRDHARTLGAYPPINAANTQINHALHQIRLINQNTNLSGSDKTVAINRLQDQITNMAQGANLRYRAATGGKQ